MVIDPRELKEFSRTDVSPDLWGRPTHDVVTGIDGSSMRVRFNDAAAAAAFADKYRAMRSNVPPQSQIACLRDGARTIFASETHTRVWEGPLTGESIAFLADAFAWWDFFVSSSARLSLHAATLRWHGSAVAIAGDSTAGKSTTAIACARAGMTLLSDERCVLREGHVIPFPRAISLREGGLALLRADILNGDDPIGTRLRAHPGEAWRNASYDELFEGVPVPEPVPLRALIVLAGFAAEPSLVSSRALDVIPRIGRWFQSSARGFDRVAQLASVLRTVPCFALTAARPNATAHLIRERISW
ncbi:MAG: hypothetical protein NVS2B17_26450 [Candidatus Velthaea sp.]